MQKIEQQPQSIQNLLTLHPECDFLRRFYTSKGIRVPDDIKTTEEWIPVLALLPGPDTTQPIADLPDVPPVARRERELGIEIRIGYSETEHGRCLYSRTVEYRGAKHVPVSILRRGVGAVEEYLNEDYWDDCEEYEDHDEETNEHNSTDREGNDDFEIRDNLQRKIDQFFEANPELREVPVNEQREEEEAEDDNS